jgi:anti-anti-sigma regulatory factor
MLGDPSSPDTLELQQQPIGPERTRLVLSGRLDRSVTDLLLSWTEDICAGRVADVELDLTGVTCTDQAGARAPAGACTACRRRARQLTITGAAAPGAPGSDGGRP